MLAIRYTALAASAASLVHTFTLRCDRDPLSTTLEVAGVTMSVVDRVRATPTENKQTHT